MPATIALDQTLLSFVLSLGVGGAAYFMAARVLAKQAAVREVRQRRDALEQVVAMLDGPAGEYLRDPSLDYPQREMVELERRALQAQLLFWHDLELEKALRDMSYPEPHTAAAERLRGVIGDLGRELERLGVS